MTEAGSGSPRTTRATRGTRVALAVAVLVQLVVLYAPAGAGAAPFPHSDKAAHVLVFLVPVALAVLVTGRPSLVAGAFLAHAGLSEVVQGTLLPLRSGDPFDAAADALGVALGVLVATGILRRSPPRSRYSTGP
ncbi:VanZ family protein [Oryzobacter sp. R7]|uniref:VanZ family protein n=1 Tax=Oryzobacter faecalis TaxID=3388656 RepID=UPI00398D61B6